MATATSCSAHGTPRAQTQTTVARAPDPSTTAPRATTTTTWATPAAPYAFDDSLPPPPLLNTGTDYAKIIESLLDYNDWLLSHRPDAALADNVDARGSDIGKGTLDDLATLRKFDRRLYETTTAPDDVVITSALNDAVSARIVQHIVRVTIVDRGGHVVSSDARATTAYNVVIVKTNDERWYLAAVNLARKQ